LPVLTCDFAKQRSYIQQRTTITWWSPPASWGTTTSRSLR
jgi:hypothetical protein